ncbi:urea carboxylase [Artomyces pyxidatus]|uniref:Urea carboxylase n=1 Tax=Artomyces pyxidatus TaxID=48021 RepID=A0ACB8TB06_9AGAM|nr:urea carboxylase [Artomyces pyxidatus]
MDSSPQWQNHKLFVANRGEIAVRIIRTAKRLGLRTIAVYTPSDALSPHVVLADEAVALPDFPEGEGRAYLSIDTQVSVAQAHGATLVHPGYGFLSENAGFARAVQEAGMTFVGPRAETIELMGLKHKARAVARRANVHIVPGTDDGDGLVASVEEALVHAARIGWPVMVKATAGGGGMGLLVCADADELREKFGAIRERAKSMFHNEGVYFERFFPSARHIEVQVFGNGHDKYIHFGERECSLQRRHQKVIEETPSPFFESHPDIRDEICAAATRLCEEMKYSSAGTVEFLVDDRSGAFHFLEMNTRIQVEHPITEQAYPSLDIVEFMLLQADAEYNGSYISAHSDYMRQLPLQSEIYAIEARLYAENPAEEFRPCPGVLQHVDFELRDVPGEDKVDWLRVDTWVYTGSVITPHFDPLLAKLIVTAPTRASALTRLSLALATVRVSGPPNNLEYLRAVCRTETVRSGLATTRWLESFAWTPNVLTVILPGLSMVVQDLHGRPTLLHGIPPSGAMDGRAHSAANILAGNEPNTEALEVIVVRSVECRVKFWVQSVVGVAGGHSSIRVRVITTDDSGVDSSGGWLSTWRRLLVPEDGVLEIRHDDRQKDDDEGGLRVYIAVKGGFPGIPTYLGSKSTSMGLGGYQGRELRSGDQITLGDSRPNQFQAGFKLSSALNPKYPKHMTLHVLAGPQDDAEFITSDGNAKFYNTTWVVSSSSNRMGIRLAPSTSENPILWARQNGGDGGSHPSNILDNAYARGSINVNGDTPVILGCEGPDMGGYVCLCVVVQGDLWKFGQLRAGCTVLFKRVSWRAARRLKAEEDEWIKAVKADCTGLQYFADLERLEKIAEVNARNEAKLLTIHASPNEVRPEVTFRQAGDAAILVEYGHMELDFSLRARVHAFEAAARSKGVESILGFGPCIRSTMCYYDPSTIQQSILLDILVEVEHGLPSSSDEMTFPGRRVTFPIVLDDQWSRNALDRYMRTTRDKAAYLPSNIEYLARNNGLGTADEALARLVGSDFLVFGVGFYLACPFLVPIDPRCRLVGQKMNPSRTFTPRGAIGIAGVVSAIYPVESPGGYQLYGRTLPAWQTWGNGVDFTSETPWLLQPFDQVHFEIVNEQQYVTMEKAFDSGRYQFKVEPVQFSMAEYKVFTQSIEGEVQTHRARQAAGVAREEARERVLLREWETERQTIGTGDPGGCELDELLGGSTIIAPLSASVWKIKCKVGDIIQSAEDSILILEAMKTEISVKAGKENMGREVTGFGTGVREGAVVGPGDVLIVLK